MTVAPPSANSHVTAERERGRAARAAVCRADHADWSPPAMRNPLAELADSDAGRLPELVPLRHERMATSPFAFLRGLPALMTADLAATASTGLLTLLCGDAHLANFGFYASPDRDLVFDLNDFDEAAAGPFEWDVKRLAVSAVVAGRAAGLDRAANRAAALAAVAAYRRSMTNWARLGTLDVWYSQVKAGTVVREVDKATRPLVAASVKRAMASDSRAAFRKLTEVVDGQRRLRGDPPTLVPLPHDDPVGECLHELVVDYSASLEPSRRHLLKRFRFVAGGRMVVGVGSVGTRCYVMLLEDEAGGQPLFLQAKQAGPAAIERHLGASPFDHHGQRVVASQHLLQAVSDVFLGWGTDTQLGGHFTVRQLRDRKGAIDFQRLGARAFADYCALCGRVLARAHARAGSASAIAGYLGRSARFDESIATFSETYADQVEADYRVFCATRT